MSVPKWQMTADNDAANENRVEVAGNHIYFYCDVENGNVQRLVRELRDMDAEHQYDSMRSGLATPKPIWLHVHSPGGSVFAGLAIVGVLRSLRSPVYSIIEGYAASAATLMTVVCRKRYILPESFMLVHQMRGWWWGTYRELEDEKKVWDKLTEQIVGIYRTCTHMDDARIREVLDRESWFTAQEAVAVGLVDKIGVED